MCKQIWAEQSVSASPLVVCSIFCFE